MNKVIYISDLQDDLLTALEGHVSTFYDSSRMVKAASSSAFSQKMMSEHLPDDKHFAIHYIALGAGEYTGFNRNGDAFPEKALAHDSGDYGTHTFVKHGYFFSEHKNRDPKKKIGDIKAAAYNKNMHRSEVIVWGDKRKAEKEYEKAKAGEDLDCSMSCFPAGTLVRLENGGTAPIETIAIGDAVLTHQGTVGKVTHTMRRDYTGAGVALQVYGIGDTLQCTEDHGIWVRPAKHNVTKCPVCGERFKSLGCHMWQKQDAQHSRARLDIGRYSEGMLAAGNVRPGDLVRQPIDRRVEATGSADMAIIAGYYLAEGSLCIIDKYNDRHDNHTGPYADHRIEWTFGIHEEHMVKDMVAAIERAGYRKPSYWLQPKYNRISVCSHQVELYDWLMEHCGKYSYAKKLSRELLFWHPDNQKILIEKWLEGDGTWHKKHELLCGTTVSQQLALDLFRLSARCSLVCMLNIDRKLHKKKKHISYILSFRNESAARLESTKKAKDWTPRATFTAPIGQLKYQTAGQFRTIAVAKSTCFVEADFIYRRVRRVCSVFLDRPVYDLTVPEHSSFTANDIGVSNCRVPGDTCSVCGNFAKSSSVYCDCLKHHMTQWMPKKAKFAYAINDEPKFFDISSVAHKADRIASHLEVRLPDEKRASFQGFTFSDEHATAEGLMLPDSIEMGCIIPEHQRLLQRLVAKEASLVPEEVAFRKQASTYAFSEPCTEETLRAMRALEPDVLFAFMAKRASVLPFNAFVAYVSNKSLLDVEADASYKSACTHLSYLFDFTSHRPVNAETERLVTPASAIKLASFGPEYREEKLLKEFAKHNTVSLADASRRMLENCALEKTANHNVNKVQLELDAQASNWLQAYGIYKVAAANAIAESSGQYDVDDSTLILLTSQHT